MSKARSPLLVCSTTICINVLNLPSFQPDITVQREEKPSGLLLSRHSLLLFLILSFFTFLRGINAYSTCLLYTSDAADDLLCVDLGGRRIIKKKKKKKKKQT